VVHKNQASLLARLGCGALFVLVLCAQALPVRAQSPSSPSATRSITVVLDDNYPPYIFRDDHGQLQGILKDTWMLWSKRTGIAVDLQAMNWDQAQQLMLSGRADVIDTMFETPERLKRYDFSAPYADIEVPIFFRASISGIANADSLKGFTVGVKAGDACINYLQARNITSLKRFPSYQALIKGAAASEVVVFCIDKPPALYLLYKSGLQQAFRYSAPLYVGQFHWAVHRGDHALKMLINNGFSQISAAERLQIQNKWMGSPINTPLPLPYAKATLEVIVVILCLLAIMAWWNYSLRRSVILQTAKQSATLRYLSATLAAIPDLMFELDGEGNYYDYRARRLDLLAMPPDQLINHNVREVMASEAADTVLAALAQAAREGASHGAQIRLSLPAGVHWFELSVAEKQVEKGASARFIMLSRDITERKNAEAEIEQLAFFDPLTQLPNRRTLQDRLKQTLAYCRASESNAALLFIDIDNFKLLNDTRGHRIGDALLKEIALHMQACLRASDVVGRFGGDEFVVILKDLDAHPNRAASEAEAAAEKLLASIRAPCRLEGFEYRPTASLGICLFAGSDRLREDEVLKRADMAMYRAKSSGRNSLCFFDPAMQAMQDTRARLDGELRHAVEEQQFELYFQAQVEQDRGIIGAEALLRWRHPQRGLVLPAQFIPLSEENGLIIPLGQWVIQSACAQLARWKTDPLLQHLFISVNVSARQFQQTSFVHDVHSTLLKHQVAPGMLKFELTETMVLSNIAVSIEKMQLLQSLGIPLSLDDFGTGYASLSYLRRLPLNEIKIDRTFMHNVTQDSDNAIIVRSIIDIAKNFELDLVAEGIEEEAQCDFLLQNGCTHFQGYLFSRPLPLAEFEALLTQPAPGEIPAEPADLAPSDPRSSAGTTR
jgi:diguanylate cyclase (GGDEF)-like protein/PAS domain S-box-containing protein